ncbi:hypothetical protein EZV62_010865 [Acer yangbiense]|uniref:Uncharacterized protein n=1 Tax=Acer yangbiense TaxID=1000413 RepID=A0A5C7I3Q1_9ROSI|nr:hypothetical protein EZV62_010865 [Acer yangbiense]
MLCKSGNTQYVPQWYQSTSRDSRVEKLEADVNSLTIGQQQILDKLNELSVQFNTRASIQPTNCPPDLEESIKADVLDGCPATLSIAIGLARLYEARNISHRRPMLTADLRKGSFPQQEGKNNNTTLPVRRLSPTELQERRAKGLCYNCNERFVPSDRCKKLFLIELCEAEGDGDVVMEEEDTEQTFLINMPEISLHAISGSRAPETMRVRGNIERISTIVLVDSRSTHNFISEVIANKVGL